MIMKKSNPNNLIEYLSLIFILSYFFVHNIFIVLIGICLSLYMININHIKSIFRYINQKLENKKVSGDIIKNDNTKRPHSINTELEKTDLKFSLVEAIEEGKRMLEQKKRDDNQS